MTIEKLEELLNAATPGPWTSSNPDGYGHRIDTLTGMWTHHGVINPQGEARLIIALRNLAPELLAVVKAAECAADKMDIRFLFGPLCTLETKLKEVL